MDYKFRTKDKQSLLADIARLGIDISGVSQESIDAGYFQDENFTVKWLGKLTIGQQWDEEGNLVSPGLELEGEFVDARIVQALPEGFQSVFQDTVLDDRYLHRFS